LDFVAEVSGATLCSVVDHQHCDDQSLGFLETIIQEGSDDVESLQKRIDDLEPLGTTDPWVWRRLQMVKQLIALKEEEASAEEL
jgi:hypothetical protein